MSPVQKVTYERKFSIAAYEHEVITLDAVVKEGENVSDIIRELQQIAAEASLGSGGAMKGEAPAKKETAKADTKVAAEKVEKAAAKAETKAATKEEPKKAADTKAEEPKKEKVSKPKASAITIYNLDVDKHRAELGSILDTMTPGWRKSDAAKAKAKETSQKLTNDKAEFIDGDGKHLESFLASVRENMSAYLPEKKEDDL